MTFWIMDNTKHCYTKIHTEQCHNCKNGRGPNSGKARYWHGPFLSYLEALTWAKSARSYVETCKFCTRD